jgi:hypothetical protein
MKKDIYLAIISIAGLIIGNTMIIYGSIYHDYVLYSIYIFDKLGLRSDLLGLDILIYGLVLLILDIIFTILVGTFMELSTKNVLRGITLVILLEMIGFSVPQHFFADVAIQYVLIYVIMLIPIYCMIKEQSYKIMIFSFLAIGIVIEFFQATIFKYIYSNVAYVNKISGEFSILCLIIAILTAMSLIGTKYKISLLNAVIDSLFPVLVIVLIFNIVT